MKILEVVPDGDGVLQDVFECCGHFKELDDDEDGDDQGGDGKDEEDAFSRFDGKEYVHILWFLGVSITITEVVGGILYRLI